MPRSIAILPFRDLTGTSGGREICDALAESLTEELSRAEGLLVAGRTSTMRLSDRTTDLQALGRQLNVGAVLEGSVQSSGAQVRVRARLFDVVSGFQLWSATFDRTSVEVFAVQDEIVRAIATTLRIQLGRVREDPAAKSSAARRTAQELFNKGRQLHRRADPAVLLEARALHMRAVEADPRYPLGHSGLAHINITVMSEGLRAPAELRPETVLAIERALSLDPGLSDAYSARVRLARDIDMDWRAVETTCRDVTRLFPNAASIRGNCGMAFAIMGRFPEAEAELRACARLDPLWPSGLDNLAWMLYLAGRGDEALRQVEEVMRIDPTFRGSRRTYSRILLGSGKFDQARKYLEGEISRDPGSTELIALLGYTFGRLNDKAAARRCLDRIGPRPQEVELALIWLGLNDTTRAAAHLERALDKHETMALDVLVDPAMQMRPQTARLRAKVGL
jgi:serine/threonine-protein kinase